MANYELRIETSEMKKSLDVLSTVISRKTALPVLQDALLRYDREKRAFTLTAGNAEQFLTLECSRPDENADGGRRLWMFNDSHGRGDDKNEPLQAVCINVALFREVFSSLPAFPAQCYLTLTDTACSMRVVHGKGEFTLPVNINGRPEEYPPVPDVVEKGGQQRQGISPIVKFSMETQRLMPLITDARCCVANDELRPVMNTVCLDCFHDHAVVVATDGHSLIKEVLDTGMGWLRYGEFPATGSAKVLIPSPAVGPLIKAFASSASLTLTADNQHVGISDTDGSVRLVTATVDGHYPNYESVIPRDQKYALLIDRQEMLTSLRRIGIFSEEASNMCVLRRAGGTFVLSASDDALGRNATEQVAIINGEQDGMPDDFSIGCKISTLNKLLDCITTDNLKMEVSEPNLPILLHEDDRASGKTLLIMPMLTK